MKAMLKEFRDFAMRGNVVDMAVGVIIGDDQGMPALLFDHCDQGKPLPALHFGYLIHRHSGEGRNPVSLGRGKGTDH